MGAPAGQVQCMICHCHTGCERTKERWRTSSVLFGVYAKWTEAGRGVVQPSRPVLSTEESFQVFLQPVKMACLVKPSYVNPNLQDDQLYVSNKVNGYR